MRKKFLACLLTAALVFTSADFTTFATETVESEAAREKCESFTEAAETEAVETEVAETETVETEVAETEAVETEVVETETVETEVVETEIVETEVAETEIVETEVAETETVETEAVETEIILEESSNAIKGSEKVMVVNQDENGNVWCVETETENTDNRAQFNALNNTELIKLGTPTDLTWNKEYKYVWNTDEQSGGMQLSDRIGVISWRPVEPDQGQAYIKFYREGDEYPYASSHWRFGSTNIPEWRSIDSFSLADPESGTYHFTIQSGGDGTKYCDSDVATSDKYVYTKPDAYMGNCSDLKWEWPNACWSGPEDDYEYYVEFYYAETKEDNPYVIGGTWGGFNYKVDISNSFIQSHGSGYYYFKVRALSDDISKRCNGAWSELSKPYNLTGLIGDVKDDLESIVDTVDTPEEAREAVQQLDTEELKSAMAADKGDEGILDAIKELEKVAGGPAPVQVSDESSAFEADKISVVGANLNDAAAGSDKPITLVVDKPEKEHVIDAAYDNSVAVSFSMTLDNVEDAENLEVPVKITMPIPATINPGFLVILHYKQNGEIEELTLSDVHTYNESGQWYASFVLTSFSDFTMTNFAQDTPEYDDEENEDILPGDLPSDGIVPDGLWIAGMDDMGYPYTGAAIKPEVRVYDHNKRLMAGKDYTISYKNNKKACESTDSKIAPTIIVKGKGDYKGSETATFKILPVSLGSSSIEADDIIVAYNKKIQKKVPTVTYDGKKLSNKNDFTVSYPDDKVDGAYKEIGSYRVLLTGKGNFKGTKEIRLVVTESTLMISKASVQNIPNQEYTGSEIEPILTVKMKNVPLTMGTDYTVSYINNEDIGTATAIITGKGKYVGTKKLTFNIVGKSLKKAKVTGITDKIYNGQEQLQSLTVELDGKKLTPGTDYMFTYSVNTVDVGKVTVTIHGNGAYSGTIKKNYKINAYDLKADTQKKLYISPVISAKYVKGGSQPKPVLKFGDKKLVEGRDYTISYKNNKAVATAQSSKAPVMIIKGKGNFKGTLQKNFAIISKALDDSELPVTMRVPDKAFVDKAGKYISKPVLTDADGKKLAEGKDYEKKIKYTLEDGKELTNKDKVEVGTKIMVTVEGKGAYSGTLQACYQITKSDFSKAKITLSSKPYTGKAVTLDEKDITVKINGNTLVYGVDYEILHDSYTNNIKRGSASVIIVGKGNYGGSQTKKFKIVQKQMLWFWKIFG